MALVRYNPHRVFDATFDRLFSDFLPALAFDGAQEGARVISPRVEIRDGEESIVLTAEVPGVDRDELKVELNNRLLTLSGEKKEESEKKENGIYRSERVYGSFKRSFTLPDEVDVEGISAHSENGVLRVTLPKKPEAKPKLIAIDGEQGASKQIDVA